jgi:hypothetical protein
MSRRLLFMAKKRGVYDSFNRANAPTMGRAETGQLWYNLIGSGGINNQQAYFSNAGSGVAMIDARMSDCIIKCDITHSVSSTGSFATGLEIKSQSTTNRIVAYVSGYVSSALYFAVEKIINGVSTGLVVKSVTLVNNPYYTMKVVCKGTTYTFYIDEALIAELTISELNNSTVFGIFKNNALNTMRFDNFSVEPI